MIVPDVNVLLYAFRSDMAEHSAARVWLEDALENGEPVGLPDVVASGFIRIVTHPAIYEFPTPVNDAIDFVQRLRSQDNCIRLEPGLRHWEIFASLCVTLQLRGVLIPDAYLAAIAIESGSEFITRDRGFSRYPGLRWRDPLS